MEMTQYVCNKKPQPIKNYTTNQQYTKTCKKNQQYSPACSGGLKIVFQGCSLKNLKYY